MPPTGAGQRPPPEPTTLRPVAGEVSVLILLLSTALAAAPRTPVPRQVLVPPPLDAGGPLAAARLTVKIIDGVAARADGHGRLRSAQPGALDPVRQVADRLGLRFRPLLTLDTERLDALEARAAARSGRAQPDLQALFIVEGPATADAMVAAGEALQALPVVEYAFIERIGLPPPED
ncbi:MAG: hypothetical protein D6798_00320, partial [Deltaproteobacteria bacterium]